MSFIDTTENKSSSIEKTTSDDQKSTTIKEVSISKIFKKTSESTKVYPALHEYWLEEARNQWNYVAKSEEQLDDKIDKFTKFLITLIPLLGAATSFLLNQFNKSLGTISILLLSFMILVIGVLLFLTLNPKKYATINIAGRIDKIWEKDPSNANLSFGYLIDGLDKTKKINSSTISKTSKYLGLTQLGTLLFTFVLFLIIILS